VTPIPPGVPGLGALGAKQLHAFYKRAEVRTLLKFTAADVVMSAQVPSEHSKQLRAWVLGIRVDPEVMGGIKRLLDEGDLSATPLVEERLRQLLGFEENDLDQFGVAELVAKAIEENVAAAKRDERTAAHVDAQMTRSLVREEMAAVRQEIAGADAKRAHEGAGAPRHRVEFSVSVRTERVLADLAEQDAEAADQLAAAIDAGGLERAVELIEEPQGWVAEGGSELLIALGRLADQAGSYSAAEAAYLRAAEMPDVRHRAREFVRAAVAAESRGDEARSEELLAEAEKVDPDAPSLAIARARRIEDPKEILGALAEVKPLDNAQEVLLELTRAGAETARGDYAEGRARLRAAELLDPESLMVKEVAPTLRSLKPRTISPAKASSTGRV
jgi:tetratricopeptide (TPR) repeat protein